jgi:hypothetical protein
LTVLCLERRGPTVSSILIYIYEGLARFPILTFGVLWLLAYAWRRDVKQAFQSAMDVSFFFMIGSVARLLKQLTGSSFGFWVLLFMLLASVGFLGRKLDARYGRVDPQILLKWVCRPGFLVLSLLYVLLWLFHLAITFSI